jgi:hypothetical protein
VHLMGSGWLGTFQDRMHVAMHVAMSGILKPEQVLYGLGNGPINGSCMNTLMDANSMESLSEWSPQACKGCL